jgi:hypothetical protein
VHSPRFFCALLAAWSCAAACPNAAAVSSFDAPPPLLFDVRENAVRVLDNDYSVGLANPHVGFVVRKSDGVVLGIWAPEQVNLLVESLKMPLWSMETMPVAGSEKGPVLAPDDSAKVSVTITGDARARTVHIAYEMPWAHVVVHVSLAAEAPLVHWRLEAETRGDNPGIWSVTFPQLPAAGRDPQPAGNQMVVPYRRGQLRGFSKSGPRGDTDLPYPGPAAKFQFLAAYSETRKCGLYFAAEDGQGFTKSFSIRNRPENNAAILGVQHFPPDRGRGVKKFALAYDMVAGPFEGDWWDAARLYREWWTKQVWASRGLLAERHDLPDWLVHAPIATRPSTTKPERTVANNLNGLRALSDAFAGKPFFGIWYGCFETATAGKSLNESGLGHLLPPKPGLVDAVRELRGRGVHLQAYIQSMIYDAGIPAHDAADADRAVTRDRQGNRVPYGGGEPQLLSMCRATDWWQNRLVELSRRAVGEWGFSGVYLDSFGKGAPECFAADHGHPIGGGNTVIQGQRALVQKVRAAVRAADPEAILSGEDPIEAFRDLLDVNLYSVNVMSNYVPIYRTVWGDYSLGHGRVLAPGKSGGSLIPELAALFLEGTIPGRIYTDSTNLFLFQPEHARELAFLKATTAYTEHGLAWLRFGEYLHPLPLEPPRSPVEFRESVENQIVHLPAVTNSVTRSHADGSVAIVLVNLATEPQTLKIPIDPRLRGEKSAGAVARLTRMNERGEFTDLASGDSPWMQSITLSPDEIAFMVLRSR